jgi:hypothetical protein
MQTLVFTKALTQIVADLKVRELLVILDKWLGKLPYVPPGSQQQQQQMSASLNDQDKQQYSSLILDSHAGYDRLSRIETTQKILQRLEANELYDPGRLTRLFVVVSGSINLGQVRANPEMYDLYETFKALSRIEITSRTLLEKEKIGEVLPTEGTIALQVIDYDGHGIEPRRLELIISILVKLHTDLARLLDEAESKLRLAYFDSGSDLVIGITAATGLITALGTLLMRFWDKYKFLKNETFSKDLESLTQGLDFLGKVSDSVEKKKITDEEAKILTTQVFRGINELYGLGASTPLSDTEAISQRQLLMEKRNVKLLGNGGTPESNPASD